MGDGCDLLDLVCLTETLSTYPAFVSNWNIGFALTASPFLKDQKGTKKSSPHRTAFAALRFPRSGSAPWARRHGPSMAHRGSPGIHAGRPTPQNLLSASREGRQIKSTAPRGGRPAGLFGQFRSGPGPGVRLVVLCGRLAPTLLWACSVFGIFCWWKWYCWTRSKSKPGVSPCRATL